MIIWRHTDRTVFVGVVRQPGYNESRKEAVRSRNGGDRPVSSVKDAARSIVENLPDEATWDDLMYELYVKQKVEEGLTDVEAGRTIPHAQVKAELLGDAD